MQLEPGFTTDMPTEVGLWEFICGENDGKVERCAITGFPDDCMQFYVHSEHLGQTPLKHFHDGLTQIRWRKIA